MGKMEKIWSLIAQVLWSKWKMGVTSTDFWWLNVKATVVALLVIVVFHLYEGLRARFFRQSSTPASPLSSCSPDFQARIPDIVTNSDLESLIDKLDGKLSEDEKWENVTYKKNSSVSYNAKCCKPKDGPLKYLSVTLFENCSPEMLRDFYMDNDYRKQWDKTVVEHEQLQVDRISGIEIGRTIKKFPLLTPREYVLAWRLWEGKHGTFYCFIKECEHHLVSRQKKYVRVEYFRSGWRIAKVPGTNACEIKMFHQEDAGLKAEMAKLAFAKGIWSYVCKMDNALRKYSMVGQPQMNTAASAVTLIHKVPPELDGTKNIISPALPHAAPGVSKERKLLRRPSKKLVANGLLLLGGAIYWSRGHSAFGGKVALAYILTKLRKRGASNQSSQGQ